MRKIIAVILLLVVLLSRPALAQTPTQEATSGTEATTAVSPKPKTDLIEPTEEKVSELRKLLAEQEPGSAALNPLKHAIRGAAEAGVPVNTLVLLLLLPLVAAVIAAARHIVGLRGFGIFLPAALSVVFVATGPIVGLGLFLVIVLASITARMLLRKSKIKLQYLPRMALILWLVVLAVLGVLFASSIIGKTELIEVSIFPVLFLVLLAEDFTRAQIGKSFRTAISLTSETLILALVSFIFLTHEPIHGFALLNPEIFLLSIAAFDFIVGKYVGLRFLEFWRFRRLISG